MPWSTDYLDRLNKSQLIVCEQKTQFINSLKKCEIKYDCDNENSLLMDPKLVMDIRHSMAKTNETFNFVLPSKEQIQSDAFKQLREENHQKLLNQKNQKLVEMEICKLKKLLNAYEAVREINKDKEYLDKLKAVRQQRKFPKYFVEYKNSNSALYMKEISKKMNVLSIPPAPKIEEKECSEEESTPTPISSRKGSLVDEISSEKEYSCNDMEPCEEETKTNLPSSGLFDLEEEDTNISENNKVSCEKESSDSELLTKELAVSKNKREISLTQAWNAWRTYTLICRKRRIEKVIYENKIKNFIARLQELKIKMKIEKQQQNTTKHKLKKESAYKKRLKQTEEIKKNENDVKLVKIQNDIKASQAEAQARLDAIKTQKEKLIKNNKVESVREKRRIVPNPKFLLLMEKRKKEREIRRKEMLEKKQKLEEERKETLRRIEEEKKMMEEEEKRQKQMEILKKKEEEKRKKEFIKWQLAQAKRHYEESLLRNGLIRWRAFVRFNKIQEQNAENIADRKLMWKVLTSWRSVVEEKKKEREEKADEFYRNLHLKKYMTNWKSVWSERIQQYQVAADWQEFRMVERFFKHWLQITHESYLDFLNKSQIAQLHYERNLTKTLFQRWKCYPAYKRQELEKEMRKQVWRQKIQQILPDYQPINIANDS